MFSRTDGHIPGIWFALCFQGRCLIPIPKKKPQSIKMMDTISYSFKHWLTERGEDYWEGTYRVYRMYYDSMIWSRQNMSRKGRITICYEDRLFNGYRLSKHDQQMHLYIQASRDWQTQISMSCHEVFWGLVCVVSTPNDSITRLVGPHETCQWLRANLFP